MVTIGVYQSLSNSGIYEHRRFEDIKNIYKYPGKYDYQYQYKFIIEQDMLSNNEGITDNSKLSPGPYIYGTPNCKKTTPLIC